MKASRRLIVPVLLLAGLATFAQYGERRRFRGPPDIGDRGGVPVWEVDKEFAKDSFTFVRIQYSSSGYRSYRGSGQWWVDYPDAELNLSYRLQQLTSLKVNPEPKVM